MAYRQFFPYVAEELLGPEPDSVLPVFPAPYEVRFKAGADVSALVKDIVKHPRVLINAAACAGKSISMPAALVRAGLGMFVHVVPSLYLAKRIHDFASKSAQDVNYHFVRDFVEGEFPKKGLVVTSASVFSAYSASWRAKGEDPGVVLYVDECHESDLATATLRRFQNATPGVSVYMEASATRGAVGGGFDYRRVITPATVESFEYADTDPAEWNLHEKGKPWSILRTTGDFLVFNDDAQQAKIIEDKFRDHGVTPFRLYAGMSLDVFDNIMRSVEARPASAGVAVLVADSTFRSGHTFPTVARIIDTCRVSYLSMDMNGPVVMYRLANASEIYQATARGGRVAGRPCHYWRVAYTPDGGIVTLEGIEADGAAILWRMLGCKPDYILQGTPFSKGLLPRGFMRLMTLDKPLRMYKAEVPWPGTKRVEPDIGGFEPVTPPSSPGSVSSARRGGSIHTVQSGEETEEEFVAPSVTERVTRVSHTLSETVMKDPASVFRAAFSKLGVSRPDVPYGEYCAVDGHVRSKRYQFQDFKEVLEAKGDMPVISFASGLSGSAKQEVVDVALSAYNGCVAVWTAAVYVTSEANNHPDLVLHVGDKALGEWLKYVHGFYIRNDSMARVAYELLRALAGGKLVSAPTFKKYEEEAVTRFLAQLGTYGTRVDQEPQAIGFSEAYDPGMYAGRYTVDVKPTDLRSRMALRILGGKDPTVEVVFPTE